MVNNSGWLKLHRSLLSWEWSDDTNTAWTFMVCLMLANIEDKNWRGQKIEKGSFVTSVAKMADLVGLSTQSLRTSFSKLKSTNELTIKTTNKYTIVTVRNWSNYQSTDTTSTNKSTNNQQTTNKQLTTTKEVKKERNNTSGISSPDIGNLKAELAKKMGGGISHKFQDDAFRAASYLSIDFTARPDLKGRWLSFFKTAGPRVQNTISYLVDYPPFMAIQDPEHRMRYFFEVYSK